jgi:hypothetical protein
VIDRADHLEVVQEIINPEDLLSAIEYFDPEWVILSPPFTYNAHNWLDGCMAQYPSVRFILLSPRSSITMKWQTSCENLADLSTRDFIHILEMDLQHI